MNQLLRELEHKQWVTRRPHPVHGRILQADLTHEGHAALRSCHQDVDAIEEQMLATLSPARRQQLTAALRTCIEALPQSRQPAP